jgi:phage-related protein
LSKETRAISWLKGAQKDFEEFPAGAQEVCLAALTIAAEDDKADIAKPMKGMGSGVFEIALRFKGDAFRVVYALQIDSDVWIIHAFQKKSKTGMKTPKQEMDLIHERLKRLKELLS